MTNEDADIAINKMTNILELAIYSRNDKVQYYVYTYMYIFIVDMYVLRGCFPPFVKSRLAV